MKKEGACDLKLHL